MPALTRRRDPAIQLAGVVRVSIARNGDSSVGKWKVSGTDRNGLEGER
jgi:hypothetical protein